jgi:hypothetical protein
VRPADPKLLSRQFQHTRPLPGFVGDGTKFDRCRGGQSRWAKYPLISAGMRQTFSKKEHQMNLTAHIDEEVHNQVLEFDLHGKLSREDYEKFVPESEKLILKYGKIRVLMTMHDFHGCDAGAFWEDVKWSTRHYNHVERLAIVGEKTWQKWMAALCRPFTTAQVRYFTHDQLGSARAWINEPKITEPAPPVVPFMP